MRQAVRRFIFALILFIPLFTFADVLKITIDGPIHPITDEFIGRAIEKAKETNATALLIELRTPGGLETSTRKIVEKIVASSVPVIIYVAPSGSRAASAGSSFLPRAPGIVTRAP